MADALRGGPTPVAEEAGHLLAAGRMADPERVADAAQRAALDALRALADDEAVIGPSGASPCSRPDAHGRAPG